MGSRLRSAAPSATGGLTEADFKKAFENTPADKTLNAKTLPQRLQELNTFLTDPNKDWSMKSKQLALLRGCLIAPIPRAVDLVAENYGLWERCLIDGLKELRSTLTREYCITIAFFSVKLGNRLIRQIELMFPNLMNLIQNSAKIMSSSAIILSEFIARYVHHSRLISLTSSNLVSKSSAVRRNVVHMFDVMLSSWDRDLLEHHINVIKEVIKSGLNDADLACRATSRDAYFAFYEKFPTQGGELYDSLDSVRQRALNDQKSAASSTNSIVQEKNNLHFNGLRTGIPTPSQAAYLDSRSRSDLHFRYGGFRAPRPPPSVSRSRNNSPTRTPQVAKARPPLAKPAPASSVKSARVNVAPRINTNLRPIPSGSKTPQTNLMAPRFPQPHPPATAARTGQPSVFGTTRMLSATRITTPAKPPSASSPTAKFSRPNVIRTNVESNDKLNGSTSSALDDSLLSSPRDDPIREIANIINPDLLDVKSFDKVTDALKKLKKTLELDQVSSEQFHEHYNSLFLYCCQLLRVPEAPNVLKMATLQALQALIEAEPTRISDKAELALFRVLDAQDRDDATLTRSAEECGASIIRHLDIERCKELLLPLISNDDVNPTSIASALKLFCRKIETLNTQEVNDVFQETKSVVVKCYEHQESMVRRAAILFFVTVSNAIGTEPLRSVLNPSIFKLVEVYRDKAQKQPKPIPKKLFVTANDAKKNFNNPHALKM